MSFISALFFVHIMYLAIFYYMAMKWLTSAIPKSIAISFASALCNNLYIYNQTRDYSMKEIMDPKEEEGLFFRNVYFQFMTTMIVGGVWFLICAKDILNLINNHCNKMFSGLVLCHDVFFYSDGLAILVLKVNQCMYVSSGPTLLLSHLIKLTIDVQHSLGHLPVRSNFPRNLYGNFTELL